MSVKACLERDGAKTTKPGEITQRHHRDRIENSLWKNHCMQFGYVRRKQQRKLS